jgi:hypothetical protein
MDNFATGYQDGTGASIDITLGWTPDRVEVHNTEAADNARLLWMTSMADASAYKETTVTGAPTRAKITTLGITPLGAAAADTARGFRIGADTDVNVAGETIQWFAFRAVEPKRS